MSLAVFVSFWVKSPCFPEDVDFFSSLIQCLGLNHGGKLDFFLDNEFNASVRCMAILKYRCNGEDEARW